MIPVVGYEGQRVAVLGLGRSGLAVARALAAGGAEPLLWDDSAEARAHAEAEGLALHDPLKGKGLQDVAAAGHLARHPASLSGAASRHRRRMGGGGAGRQRYRPVLPLLCHAGLGRVRHRAAGDCGDRVERQVDDLGADPSSAATGRPADAVGRQHRPRGLRPRSGAGRRGGGAGTVQLPDRSGAVTDPGCRCFHELFHGPSGSSWRSRRLFRRQAAAVRRRRARPGGDRRGRERGPVSGQPDGRGGGGRPGDPHLGRDQADRAGLERVCAQGIPVRMAQGAAGRGDRPARNQGLARRA